MLHNQIDFPNGRLTILLFLVVVLFFLSHAKEPRRLPFNLFRRPDVNIRKKREEIELGWFFLSISTVRFLELVPVGIDVVSAD